MPTTFDTYAASKIVNNQVGLNFGPADSFDLTFQKVDHQFDSY